MLKNRIQCWTNCYSPSSITQLLTLSWSQRPRLWRLKGASQNCHFGILWPTALSMGHFFGALHQQKLDEIGVIMCYLNLRHPGRNECGHSFPGESGQSPWSSPPSPPACPRTVWATFEISQNGLYRIEYNCWLRNKPQQQKQASFHQKKCKLGFPTNIKLGLSKNSGLAAIYSHFNGKRVFQIIPIPISFTDLGICGWLKSLSTTMPWIKQVSSTKEKSMIKWLWNSGAQKKKLWLGWPSFSPFELQYLGGIPDLETPNDSNNSIKAIGVETFRHFACFSRKYPTDQMNKWCN